MRLISPTEHDWYRVGRCVMCGKYLDWSRKPPDRIRHPDLTHCDKCTVLALTQAEFLEYECFFTGRKV